MCGIAGIVRWDPPVCRPGEIERMTRTVAHRGPDGEGVWASAGIALGHRRLAIIDLESGGQPMTNEDGTILLTFNGEIYNYRELRSDLCRRGHHFATQSDTEVIVHAYEEWGADCVERFRGMFAFGIADMRRRRLFLARDPFGIKPLYYRRGSGYLAFASELAALREVDDIVPTGDLQAVDYYFRFQYIPTPQTIYQEVYKLPPANTMMVDFDGRVVGPNPYWSLRFEPEDGISDAEWCERAEAALRDSVRAHLVSDVPFGVFLSGGIDSTAVALAMSRILERPVRAFAIGFEEAEYSELAYARAAAERCGIELRTELVRDDALDFVPELVAHYGEPFGDSSAIPTWHVSRLARSEVPMVLSGDGGDEAFAGYDRYVRWMGANGCHLRGPNPSAAWQRVVMYLSDDTRHKLWRDEYRGLVDTPCPLFEQADRKARAWDRLAYSQHVDYETYLPCCILTKVDVASMFHGLEVRTPLIDPVIAKLAASLPLSQRVRRNENGEPVGKYLLKQALCKVFSPDFVHRRKAGFCVPLGAWWLPGRPARRRLEEVLLSPGSRLHAWLNRDCIERHLRAHDGRRDISGALWLLFVLGHWLEQNPEVRFA